MRAIELPHHALRFPPTFTRAEREVVLLVLEGLSNAQIAARRRRSARTVANQLAAVLEKADVYTRAELLAACAPPEPLAPGSWSQLLERSCRVERRRGALRFVATERRRCVELSPSERAAVEAAAAGAPNKQIAPLLGVGLRVAGRRVECAVEKLGIPRLYLPLLRALSVSCPRPGAAPAA